MAIGIFIPGIDDLDTVLAIRSAIIDGMFATNGGLTTINWSAEGIAVSRQFAVSPYKLLEEIKLYLQTVDPDLYGRRITRTSPGYLL